MRSKKENLNNAKNSKARLRMTAPYVMCLAALILGMFALSVARYGVTLKAAFIFAAALLIFAVALEDAKTGMISDAFSIALLILGAASFLVFGEMSAVQCLLGAACIAMPMMLFNLAMPGSFGGGDIFFCFSCGVLLGVWPMLAAGVIACLAGGIYGIILISTGHGGLKSSFPFGPFLAGGILISLFAGDAASNFIL